MTRPKHDAYRLFRYVALGAGEGIVAGCVVLLLILKLDLMGLDTLFRSSENGTLALALLFFLFGITFGMVGIAWRVMVLLPDEDRDP